MKILVLNAGSSSMKFKLYDMAGGEQMLAEGNCQRVGLPESETKFVDARGNKRTMHAPLADHKAALDHILHLLTQGETKVLADVGELGAVGHRVSMGGAKLVNSLLIDEDAIGILDSLKDVTPLHTPPQVAAIRACRALLGEEFPMVGAFDTAFHQTIPQHAYMLSCPYEYYEKHQVRKMGFHGLSHHYVTDRYAQLTGRDLAGTRLITCHLGGGSSVSAVRDGKSIENTFGFGVGEGPMCGTRAGTFDHTALPYIMEKEALSFEELADILNRKSGLLGISGLSSDEYELEKAAAQGHRRAGLALEMMAYHIRKYIGAYAFVMGGVGAILFMGGIGENSDYMREKICAGLESFGIVLDEDLNRELNRKEGKISAAGAPVEVWVVPTNEEIVIARDTFRIVLEQAK